jgi:hypothetical protein
MFDVRGSAAPGVWRVIAQASLAWLVGTGCGGSGGTPVPKTYPVTGRVLYKSGQPLPGGVLQFQSASDPNLTAKGEIEADGTFELVTLFQNGQLPGATEGKYHVTVIPRMSDNKPVPIYELPGPYTVKATDNYFSIELEKPGVRAPK